MKEVEKYEKALRFEIFSKEEYGFSKEKIKNSKCIFDIGTHIGLFSEWCLSYNKNLEIHCFEPVKQNFDKAKKNLGHYKNVFLNNYGIGNSNSEGNILINETKTMQSSKFSSFLNPKGSEELVQFKTLSDYLIKKDISHIDLLKMDIEGMEFEVLPSWTDLERNIIQNFIAEIHLLDNNKKAEWNLIFNNIKIYFNDIKIIPSGYRDEIFLVWCQKN